MKPNQIAELGEALSQYVVSLKRAPTAKEVEIFIKTWITCKQKGKLLSVNS